MRRLISSSSFYTAALLACLLYLLSAWPAVHNGDVAEYTLTTLAVANHGTPDIRLADLEEGQRRLPWLAYDYSEIDRNLKHQPGIVNLPFAKGSGDKIYAAHFFAFSALAAVPFKLLPLAGMDPFKCYLALNLCCVFILGLSLRRLLQDNLKALCMLGLALTCGIWAYLRWTTPETMAVAALLSALALFSSGAPLRASLLAALGAMQNPSIVFVFGWMPLLRLALDYQPGRPWRAQLGEAVQGARGLACLAGGALLGLTPMLWNQLNFGFPSLIGHIYTRSDFVSLTRLHSLFFDLSQGMIIGLPAVALLLLAWSVRLRGQPAPAAGLLRLLAACALLTLMLALPTLGVVNWNSGAQGVMRYATWIAMPLLFALAMQLRARRRWLAPVLAVLLLQIGVSDVLGRFRYVEFSPLARRVLEHAPQLYNPEPELFAERIKHIDNYFDEPEVYAYRYHERVTKTLYHDGTPAAIVKLCGEGGALSPDNAYVDSTRGWRYINGEVKCVAAPH
ncbi:hypothetical protein [Duganella violaceipulchra]|uniref:Uncharacterized protein n=1 Tax=Duganella violaceipulchra TaxID=2849652 RepID=A0AA41HAX8_9BURK|nr:hypothetical protein [Duganella violaceicalia]MBV6320423.1 hypothetical protein [Duganella violaceicalia]MCP2012258.1 hypothetical protein [Duganella violaceicalia]